VERLLRLGVPLVFATLTIIPVAPWLRLRATDPGYHESYLHFLPRFFAVHPDFGDFPFVLQGTYFETGHLWFVVLLLAFSLILAALVRRLPHKARRAVGDGLDAALRRRGGVLLPALPVALISALLGLEENYAAWSRWAYLVFFLYGFALAADARLRAAVHREPLLVTVLAAVLSLGGLLGFLLVSHTADGDPFTDMTPLAITVRALYGAAGWCLLVVILRMLDRRRPASDPGRPRARPRRLPAYLAAAVLPLYILHQPIVVAVAYGVVGWHAPISVKYCAVVGFSLVLTFAAYDLLVRRTRLTRFLFGMRGPAPTMRPEPEPGDR
jgi:peptidoglycan/LPS O-acetylase OafA/YrhL